MTKLHEDLTDEVSEIAQRVRDTKKRAPTVSLKMVDGIGQLTIGKASEYTGIGHADTTQLMLAAITIAPRQSPG